MEDLTEAAERWAFGNYPAVDMGEPWRTMFRQAGKLADAYLSEHDKTPITLEFAEKIFHDSTVLVCVRRGQVFAMIDNADVWLQTFGQAVALKRGLGMQA